MNSSQINSRAADYTEDIDFKMVKASQTEELEDSTKANEARQVASEKSLDDAAEDMTIPRTQIKAARGVEKSKEAQKAEHAKESVLVRKEAADLANNFNKKRENLPYRLNEESLTELLAGLLLGERFQDTSDIQGIINEVTYVMTTGGHAPDVVQVNKTFDFLIEGLQVNVEKSKLNLNQIKLQQARGPKNTEDAQRLNNLYTLAVDEQQHLTELLTVMRQAQDQHFKANTKEIEVGRNLIDVADAIVEQGKAETPETLAYLREIIHTPEDLITKYNHYKGRGYGPEDIKKETNAILSYIGTQFKKTDILPAEMHVLMKQTRTAQALLQIFRTFKKSEKLFQKLCNAKGIEPPPLNFEVFSTVFMKLVEERYPSAERINQIMSSSIEPLVPQAR